MRTCLSSLFSLETTLKSNHNFLIESISHLHTTFLSQESWFNYIPAYRLGQRRWRGEWLHHHGDGVW